MLLARKVMVPISPELVVMPLGITPTKLAVPRELSYAGGSTQTPIMDFPFDGWTMLSLLASKLIFKSIPLILVPFVLIRIGT